MSDELIKEIEKIHAIFNLAKHHGSGKEEMEIAANTEAVLSNAITALRKANEVTQRLADELESHAMDRATLKKCRAALESWSDIFMSRLVVIRQTAGDKVATAVMETRLALGTDINP